MSQPETQINLVQSPDLTVNLVESVPFTVELVGTTVIYAEGEAALFDVDLVEIFDFNLI
jgi:hypothetical protein